MLLDHQTGAIWLGTVGGVTRFRPPPSAPPPVVVEAVVADKRYVGMTELSIPSTVVLTTFEFAGYSFKTRPGGLIYRYRLKGFEDEWKTTRQRRVEYENLPIGSYTFEVQAVDRDLAYSEKPATVALEVRHQPVLSSLTLSELHLQNLFASFYQTYAQQPIGSVLVTNNAPNPMEATLSLYLPDLMRRPFKLPLTLAPQSSRQIELSPILDSAILDLEEPTRVQAEVALSFEGDEQTVSLKKTKDITVYGRGSLQWDSVARAAAFITPTDPDVVSFARSVLVAFDAEIDALGKPGRNLLQALVLFEALKQHGVGYRVDANTPFARVVADQSAVDDIQYPAELLRNKVGDCDDLTSLYCALLENAGVATALVDYPAHIFLLFDTGVKRQNAYQLPLEPSWYIEGWNSLWIPLEITLLDKSFQRAWRVGIEELAELPEQERFRRTVSTDQAWKEFPPATPKFEGTVAAPERAGFEAHFLAQYDELKDQIDAYIETTYLDQLKSTPDNDMLRLELIRLYLALRQYDTAINTATNHLLEEVGDKAATYNHLGIAYLLKGEMLPQAALNFKQAMALRPEDKGLKDNLAMALQKMGKTERQARQQVAGTGGEGQAKGAVEEMDVDDFYWME